MTTYIVSRHAGALAWLEAQGVVADCQVEHLEPERIQPGDCVIGILPINLAAQVCARGGRYLHLAMHLPREWRGRELSMEEMMCCHVQLAEFDIQTRTTREPCA
ncbi:MAG: CRISPR-associated protein Csx16 [Magnetococcales bacterium]|nr:CRISPR-associated protein Csx16 [Magnetococcales bacterium]